MAGVPPGRARGHDAPTNETVVALNLRAQRLRAFEREIEPGPSVEAGPYRLHVGDVVATRHNDRDLRTDWGLMVKNRDQWEVTAVHPDGGLSLTGRTGNVRLPAKYVAEHVELAYAQTAHANQGRTVDRSFLLLDSPADTRGVYVPMTRGRRSNEAFVVLEGEETARDVLAQALSRSWIDVPALARAGELERPRPQDDSRGTEPTLDPERLRELLERDHEIGRTLSHGEMGAKLYRPQLEEALVEREELDGKLEAAEHQRDHARAVLEELDRPLVRRLHRSEISQARAELNRAQHTIEQCGSDLAELDKQIPKLRASLAKAEATLADRPGLERERHTIQRELDGDLSARARSIADDPPEHVVEALGPRPNRAAVADLWDEAASRLDQHESAFPSNSKYRHLGTSRFWDDTPVAASRRAVDQACSRLDRSLGRGHGIEPPGLELGLSL